MTVKAPFRLAFRVEGDHINCYFASPDTMEDAQWIASVHRGLIEKHSHLWDEWKALMVAMFERHLKDMGITTQGWIAQPAPPHEEAGES